MPTMCTILRQVENCEHTVPLGPLENFENILISWEITQFGKIRFAGPDGRAPRRAARRARGEFGGQSHRHIAAAFGCL